MPHLLLEFQLWANIHALDFLNDYLKVSVFFHGSLSPKLRNLGNLEEENEYFKGNRRLNRVM